MKANQKTQKSQLGVIANSRILSGIKVLDLTRYLSGPQATLYLADLGADVVRVDDPKKGGSGRNCTPVFWAKWCVANKADRRGSWYCILEKRPWEKIDHHRFEIVLQVAIDYI